MAILPRDSNEKVDVVRLEFACRQIIIERFLRFELLVELIALRYHISCTLSPSASAKNAQREEQDEAARKCGADYTHQLWFGVRHDIGRESLISVSPFVTGPELLP